MCCMIIVLVKYLLKCLPHVCVIKVNGINRCVIYKIICTILMH